MAVVAENSEAHGISSGRANVSTKAVADVATKNSVEENFRHEGIRVCLEG